MYRILCGYLLAVAMIGYCALGDAADQIIHLRFSHYLPATHNHHKNVILPWIKEIEQRTHGRVKVTVFPAGSLCKPQEQYDCVKSGLADIVMAVPGWTPGRFPRTAVLELPFLFRSAATGSQMAADLWELYLRAEYDDVHVLNLFTHAGGHIHTAKRPIQQMEDLRGMKIRIPTAIVGDFLERLGATKVAMPAPEIYEAVAHGAVDGFVMPFEALPSFRLNEVVKYHTDVGMYGVVFATLMNKTRYESLPPGIRTLFDATTAPSTWRAIGASWDRAEAVGRQSAQTNGQTIYPLPRDERLRWRELAAPLDQQWAMQLETKGLLGKALLKTARDLSVKYHAAE